MEAVKEYTLPAVDRRELLRYMGVRGDGFGTALIERVEDELLPLLTSRVCQAELSVRVDGERVNIGGRECVSRSLSSLLADACSVVIFVATVGAAPDRLIGKYKSISPSLALIADALGSERVEALCELFCDELRCNFDRMGYTVTSRFSAGYGDLSLDFQRDIFALLSPDRKIGVTLGESLLMSPTKSVSAIVGILPGSKEKK